MSKNADLIAASEALRMFFISEPEAVPNDKAAEAAERIGAVLKAHGFDVVYSDVFSSMGDTCRKYQSLLDADEPPNPWPFPLLAAVVIDGAIEAKVIGHEFDGHFKTKCAYWFHGQMFEVCVATDRLSSPS